jgi:two-component system cell cycle response regulator
VSSEPTLPAGPRRVVTFDDDRTPTSTPVRVDDHGIKRPCLVRLTGAQLGEVVMIERELVIGRDVEGGLSLMHDRGVSREHAKVVVVGDGALLVDLGSTNGTFVDGVRVKEKLLTEGVKIRIGQTTVLKYARYDDAELRMQRRLVDEALRDGMTRVFNRRYFMERLDSELGFGDRHGTPVSLVLFDLDHFKALNDEYGHLVGDRVLCELAQVCQRTVRNEDVLARYGGEEFIVLLRGILHDGAARLAERLRRGIELANLGGALVPPRPVTISLGVATFTTADYRPVKTARERLVGAADAALYRAKDAGRNCVKS